MSEVYVLDHPLIQNKLTRMRRKETNSRDFRTLLKEISMLMAFEVTRNFETKLVEVETPICKGEFPVLKEDFITIVPIIRAGIGLVDGMLELLPTAHVGFIGMERDEETHIPREYYCKMPPHVDQSLVIIVDPMLATGGSMEMGYKALLTKGQPKKVHVVCVIATPNGIDHIRKTFPEDTTIWCAAVDPGLNEHKYIVPGFGDAGDLCYGGKI